MSLKRTQVLQERLLEEMTWPERILWSRLRSRQIGYSFQHQAIMLEFVLDFYCPKAKVAVELDGPIHDRPEKRQHDAIRDDILTRSGIDVLRFPNSDVFKGMSAVLLRIWEHCYSRAPIPIAPYIRANPRDRQEQDSDFVALRAFQQDKRMQIHADNFSHRYWKSRRISVKNQGRR